MYLKIKCISTITFLYILFIKTIGNRRIKYFFFFSYECGFTKVHSSITSIHLPSPPFPPDESVLIHQHLPKNSCEKRSTTLWTQFHTLSLSVHVHYIFQLHRIMLKHITECEKTNRTAYISLPPCRDKNLFNSLMSRL